MGQSVQGRAISEFAMSGMIEWRNYGALEEERTFWEEVGHCLLFGMKVTAVELLLPILTVAAAVEALVSGILALVGALLGLTGSPCCMAFRNLFLFQFIESALSIRLGLIYSVKNISELNIKGLYEGARIPHHRAHPPQDIGGGVDRDIAKLPEMIDHMAARRVLHGIYYNALDLEGGSEREAPLTSPRDIPGRLARSNSLP